MRIALVSTALFLASCAAPVAFECEGDAPLCVINSILDDPRPRARGVTITRVALYQGVEVDLMSEGEPSSVDLPIVAGRDAMVRVFVAPQGSTPPRNITARFYLHRDGHTVGAGQAVLRTDQASTQSDLASTANITLPGSMLADGDLDWSVELVEASQDVSHEGVELGFYPTEGVEAALSVVHVGDLMRVHLVPIEYNGDDSGRLTPIDDAFVEYFRVSLMQMYPTAQVEIEVGDPFPWDKLVNTGAEWSELLGAMAGLRGTRSIDGDQYVYGVFDPGPDYAGGIAGLSMLAGVPEHEVGRSSIGISRGEGHGGSTFAHEVGHAAGRPHSPCGGAAGPDPDYPHAEAHLGTWGYDLYGERLLAPDEHHDFMSYCGPEWVSDYNWQILFDRQLAIHEYYYGDPVARVQHEPWRMVWMHPDGTVDHGDVVWLGTPPQGETHRVTVLQDGREVELQGILSPFSHVDGGVLHVPTGRAIDTLQVGDGAWIAPRRPGTSAAEPR